MSNEKQSCMNCLYQEKGKCLRYPPTTGHLPNKIWSCFPSVPDDTWCGEYSKEGRPPKWDVKFNRLISAIGGLRRSAGKGLN